MLLAQAISAAGAGEAQAIEWQQRIGGNVPAEAGGVAVDAAGNVYVTGSVHGPAGAAEPGVSRMVLAKYSPAGKRAWVHYLGGEGFTFGGAVAVAPDGAIYVSGSTSDPELGTPRRSGENILVAAYRPDGGLDWVATPGGSANESGASIAATADAVYVAGYTNSPRLRGQASQGSDDAFVMRLDRDGQIRWTRLLGGKNSDGAASVTATPSGVYLAGSVTGAMPGGPPASHELDLFVSRFSARGVQQWTRFIGDEHLERGTGITAVPGGVVVAGDTSSARLLGQTSAGSFDVIIARYDRRGELQWLRLVGGSELDQGAGIAFDPETALLHVTGQSISPTFLGAAAHGATDILLLRCSLGGNCREGALVGGSGDDWGSGVATAGDASVLSGTTLSDPVTTEGGQDGQAIVVAKVAWEGG